MLYRFLEWRGGSCKSSKPTTFSIGSHMNPWFRDLPSVSICRKPAHVHFLRVINDIL